MKPYVARLVAVAAALAMMLVATPAFAATTSVTDANDEGDPDIRRLTLVNGENAVVLKHKYEELDYVQVETFYINWGEATHYRVNRGNYDSDDALETRLTLVRADGSQVQKSCSDMTARRFQDTEESRIRVPRSCLPKALNRVSAKGVATMGLYNMDETRRTERIARG